MQKEEFPLRESPPRILHLIHGLNFGGIENWVLAMFKHMPRDRVVMDVCYKGPNEGGLADQARTLGAEVIPCRLGPTVLPFVRRLRKILQQGRYSLLHVHTHAHSGPAVYAAKAVGVPVVTTFHSTQRAPQTTLTRLPGIRTIREVYARRSVRFALLNSAVSNGVSTAVTEAVTKSAGLPPSRAELFYLGCVRPQPVSAERIDEYRKELKLSDDAPVVVHVGSFRDCKNHAGILQAFRKVVDAVPGAVLLLIGDGPLRPMIEERTRQLGLDSQVRLLGIRRDATALMQLGNVFLFPSFYEGLSVALMEAGAVGIPIVASDIPGNREATNGGVSARLHDVADTGGMAAAVIELLGNPLECQQMGELGREFYEQTFSIEVSVNRLMALYRRVLETQRSGATASRIAA